LQSALICGLLLFLIFQQEKRIQDTPIHKELLPMSLRKVLSYACSAAVIAAFSANAQQSISGLVKSATQSGIAGVTVKLVVAGDSAITDATGKFTISNLPIAAVIGRAAAPRISEPSLQGTKLRFAVDGRDTRVALDLFTIDGKQCRSLFDKPCSPGSYVFEVGASGLAAGLHVAKLRIGNRTFSYKISLANHASTGEALVNGGGAMGPSLAKQTLEIIDTIVTKKDGFVRSATPIAKYSGNYTIVVTPRLASVNSKIYSERTMAQIDWGNTTVEVWDNGGGPYGTQLNGNYPDAFEGNVGWQVTCGASWSAWVFKSTKAAGEDLSGFVGGSLHLAIKGTAPSVGVTVSPVGDTATSVDLTAKGYSDDGLWHEINIPLTEFGLTDLSSIGVYACFKAPAAPRGPYASGLTYVIDDLYFKPKP
jgi:hypothetical protein